jgi:CRP/FNR family cyclic AMP-dependent transcriptional regulator
VNGQIGYNQEGTMYSPIENQVRRSAMPIPPSTLCEIPLCAGLTEAQQRWLAERMHSRTLPAGIDLITAGAVGEVVYILLRGSVKVYTQQLDGSQVIVNILGPGETVGEMSLVERETRSASVVTLEETTVLWMNQVQFDEALQTMPALARNVMQILSRRVRSSTQQIRTLASLDVNGRLAQQLLTFADRYGRKQADGSIYIPLRLPQNELAELVGASRKRVNQVMVLFKRAGWVTIDEQYHITLRNPKALQRGEWL